MLGIIKGLISSVFGWVTAKQNTVTAQVQEKTTKDQNPNIHAQTITNLVSTGHRFDTFWLDSLLLFLVYAYIYNTLAMNFGWEVLQMQNDPLQTILLIIGCGGLKMWHVHIKSRKR